MNPYRELSKSHTKKNGVGILMADTLKIFQFNSIKKEGEGVSQNMVIEPSELYNYFPEIKSGSNWKYESDGYRITLRTFEFSQEKFQNGIYSSLISNRGSIGQIWLMKNKPDIDLLINEVESMVKGNYTNHEETQRIKLFTNRLRTYVTEVLSKNSI